MNELDIKQMPLTKVQKNTIERLIDGDFQRLAELYNMVDENLEVVSSFRNVTDVLAYFKDEITNSEAMCIVQLYGVLKEKYTLKQN